MRYGDTAVRAWFIIYFVQWRGDAKACATWSWLACGTREGLTLVLPRLLQFYASREYSFSQPVGWVWFCFFRVAAALLQAVQERVDFILYSARSGSQQQRRLIPSKVEYTCFYVSSTSFGRRVRLFFANCTSCRKCVHAQKRPRYPSVSDFCRGTAAL